MNKQCYSYQKSVNDEIYAFTSIGNRGGIVKAVYITKLAKNPCSYLAAEVYNLAFGDVKEEDNHWIIDDSARSGNGDISMVLSTVARIAIEFLKKNKGVGILFQGYMDSKSTKLGRNQRNILYQRGIDSNWQELSSAFNIWGLTNEEPVTYVSGEQYDQILFMHK